MGQQPGTKQVWAELASNLQGFAWGHIVNPSVPSTTHTSCPHMGDRSHTLCLGPLSQIQILAWESHSTVT